MTQVFLAPGNIAPQRSVFKDQSSTRIRRRPPSVRWTAAHVGRFFSGQNPCRLAMRSVILTDAPTCEANRRDIFQWTESVTTMSSPQLVVIGGPNGSGKTTAASRLLRDTLHLVEFVNADTIASGLSGFHPESAALQAGRIMLKRLHNLASRRADFAFESTLASRGLAPWINRLKQDGYIFHLAYLWLPKPEIAIARVAERVRAGGHDIPETTIRRRYDSGLRNFFGLYRPIANNWRFYDNAATSGPRPVAIGEGVCDLKVRDIELWKRIRRDV